MLEISSLITSGVTRPKQLCKEVLPKQQTPNVEVPLTTRHRLMMMTQMSKILTLWNQEPLFCADVGCEVILPSLTAKTIQDFGEQWEVMKKHKEEEVQIPEIARDGGILKWTMSFANHCNQKITKQDCFFGSPVTQRQCNQRCSLDTGSVEAKPIAHCALTDAKAKEDNKVLFCMLVDALANTACEGSLVPFKEKLEACKAWQAILKSCAGKEKWEEEAKKCTAVIAKLEWKSMSNQSIKVFFNRHQNAKSHLDECSRHIE